MYNLNIHPSIHFYRRLSRTGGHGGSLSQLSEAKAEQVWTSLKTHIFSCSEQQPVWQLAPQAAQRTAAEAGFGLIPTLKAAAAHQDRVGATWGCQGAQWSEVNLNKATPTRPR